MEARPQGRHQLEVKRRLARPAALAFAAMVAAGCVTGEQLDVVRRDVETLSKRVDGLEKTLDKDRARLSAAVEGAEADLKRLDEILKSATKLLAREGADIGVRVDAVEKDVGGLRGSSEETALQLRALKDDFLSALDRVDRIDKAVRDIGAKVEEVAKKPALPDDPEALHAVGKARLDAGAYGEAREIFREYAKRAPKGPSIEDARFSIALTYLGEKEWEKAIRDFKGYLDAYPAGSRADEAWYDIGAALFELGDCTRAAAFLTKVETDFKKSPFAKKAKDLQKTIKSAGKKKCVG
jgi:TolA-binding protein